MKQRLFEAGVLFEQAFELFVLVGRIAAYERERGGDNREAASEHDQIVGDVEDDVDAFAAFGSRLDLLIVDALRDPEA